MKHLITLMQFSASLLHSFSLVYSFDFCVSHQLYIVDETEIYFCGKLGKEICNITFPIPEWACPIFTTTGKLGVVI